MPTLSLTKNYADLTLLLADDFDVFLNELETLLNVTQLNDDNIQNDGITASSKLVTSSVTAAKILNSNVTTAKIADSAVTTAKITDANVTTAKIAASAVTTAKIADANITYAKIADSAITKPKIRASIYQKSSSASGSLSTATTTSIGSATITTAGRPVMVFLEAASSSSHCYIEAQTAATTYATFTFDTLNPSPDAPTVSATVISEGRLLAMSTKAHFYRSATLISSQEHRQHRPCPPLRTGGGGSNPTYQPVTSSVGYARFLPSEFFYIDQPAAGTYTYSIELENDNVNNTITWANIRVVALEI